MGIDDALLLSRYGIAILSEETLGKTFSAYKLVRTADRVVIDAFPLHVNRPYAILEYGCGGAPRALNDIGLIEMLSADRRWVPAAPINPLDALSRDL